MPVPLLRLPKTVLRLTVSSMELLDSLTFGLCSEKSRKLIASLELQWHCACIHFEETPSFVIAFPISKKLIMHLNSTRAARNAGLITEIQVDSVDAEFGIHDELGHLHGNVTRRNTWTKPEWSFEDWAEFVIEIFGMKFGTISFAITSQIYNLASLKLQLQDLHGNVVVVQDECPKEYHRMVYDTFQPLNGTSISSNPYPNSVSFQGLLLQNFSYLELHNTCPVALEELLITNSKNLELYNCTSITTKDINRFIRLWQKCSNCAMMLMEIRIPVGEVFEIEKVLKETGYQKAPEEREREMRNDKYVKYAVTGGYDVRGKNGRRATVKIDLKDGGQCLEFHVWP